MNQQTSHPVVSDEILSSPLADALQELLKAHQYAADCVCSHWEMAIEIATLKNLGLSPSDLRWLVGKGYAKQARETTSRDDHRRSFQTCTPLKFCQTSCFILTDLGVEFASTKIDVESIATREPANAENDRQALPRPQWDKQRHELWFDNKIVKQFRGRAQNQVTILTVFEEEEWPPRIDDPLPRSSDTSPKRRLHDTVKCLNRNQLHTLLRFRGDGTGQGVIWESTALKPRIALIS